jgi:hypothetical protein
MVSDCVKSASSVRTPSAVRSARLRISAARSLAAAAAGCGTAGLTPDVASAGAAPAVGTTETPSPAWPSPVCPSSNAGGTGSPSDDVGASPPGT